MTGAHKLRVRGLIFHELSFLTIVWLKIKRMGLLQKFPIHKNILLVKNMIQLRESSLFCLKSNSQLILTVFSELCTCVRAKGEQSGRLSNT